MYKRQVVDVEVAGGAAQLVVCQLDGAAVGGEHRAGQRIRAGGVDDVEDLGVLRVVVDVHGDDRPEVLGGEHLVARIVADQHGGLDEVADRVVVTAAGEHLDGRFPRGPVQRRLVLGEGAGIDHGAAEVGEVGDVAVADAAGQVGQLVAQSGVPDRARHVGAGGRRAFLALVFEGAASEGSGQRGRVGRGVHDDEVLAAGLPDDAGVAAVVVQVLADGAPQLLEGGGGAGEVQAGEAGVGQRDLADGLAVPGDQVDHARRESGGLEQPHGEVRGELLRGRGLPHHGVAHQRRGGGQVARDGGEVEGGDGGDEAVQRAVVQPVPLAGYRARLFGHDLACVVHVEPQEVDELAGGVDLGLLHRLGLAQDGGGVDGVAPRSGQQVGGAQQHRGTFVEGGGGPSGRGVLGGLHGLGHVLRGGLRGGAEHVLVVVGLHDVEALTAGHPLRAADGLGELDAVGLQLRDALLQRLPFRRSGRIALDRLVVGHRDRSDGVHGQFRLLAGKSRCRAGKWCCHLGG